MNNNDTPQQKLFRFSGVMKAKCKLTGDSSFWSELYDVGKFSCISHTWTDALGQLVAATDTSSAKYYFELNDVEGL